jgi:hypothetical protein
MFAATAATAATATAAAGAAGFACDETAALADETIGVSSPGN